MTMKKKLLLPTILFTYMFLSTACVQKQPTNINHTTTYSTPDTPPLEIATSVEPSTNEYQTPAPSANGITHQLPTIQGDSITIVENGNVGFDFPQYRGKVIIFEIFGKDCEYCVEEMPIINRVKNEFSNQVKVVAIQGQDRMSPSIASSILRQHNIDYPVIEGDDAKDILRFLADTYAWRGILPYILLIKDGTTEYTFPDGGVGYQELRESIKSLL
jgi:thiol-disulfide isomerase/thioredoxin